MNKDEEAGFAGLFPQARNLEERCELARVWLDEHLRTDPEVCRGLIAWLLPQVQQKSFRSGLGWLQFHQGWLLIDSDDYDQAVEALESARGHFEALTQLEGLSRCLNALAFIHYSRGLYDLALDNFRTAAELAEKAGNLELAATATSNMAECLVELDEPEEALRAIERCRDELSVAPHNRSPFHNTAGMVYKALGRWEDAEHELRQSISLAGNALRDAVDSRQILAEVLIETGRYPEAELAIEAGIQDCLAADLRLFTSRFYLHRAKLRFYQGRTGDTLVDIESALALARQLGSLRTETEALKYAWKARQSCGEYQLALEALEQYSNLKERSRSEQTLRRVRTLQDDRARREIRHLERLYRQVSAISRIGQRITSSLDLDVALENIYSSLNELMDAPTVMIAMVNEQTRSLDYRLVMIQGVQHPSFSRPLDKENFGCWCATHGQDILIGDLENEYQRYVKNYHELVFDGTVRKSLVFVPLINAERVVGVLSVQSHLSRAYDREKVEVIKAIGSYIAIAIANNRLFQQMNELASVDSLTRLFNRRRVVEVLEECFLSARRYQRPVALIMLDLDHFKQINDAARHDGGDCVLRAVGELLRQTIRGCDVCGRYGGEEFIIVMPETGLDGAVILAERLRHQLRSIDFASRGYPDLEVRASFGVAAIASADDRYDQMVKRADQALYRAKGTGRDRVCTQE